MVPGLSKDLSSHEKQMTRLRSHQAGRPSAEMGQKTDWSKRSGLPRESLFRIRRNEPPPLDLECPFRVSKKSEHRLGVNFPQVTPLRPPRPGVTPVHAFGSAELGAAPVALAALAAGVGTADLKGHRVSWRVKAVDEERPGWSEVVVFGSGGAEGVTDGRRRGQANGKKAPYWGSVCLCLYPGVKRMKTELVLIPLASVAQDSRGEIRSGVVQPWP